MKRTLVALSVLSLAACAPTTLPPADSATTPRVDATADRTAPQDSGVGTDSGTNVDTGVRTDSGVRVDSGVIVDSGVVLDSGVSVDSGVVLDSGVSIDSGVVLDSGVSVDAASSDAAVVGDAAPPGEGGTGAGGYTAVRMASGATCEALTSAAIAELTGDDAAMSAPAMLPFAISYFGATATHWSASTNGIAQLWPSAAGAPSTDYSNSALPDTGAPEGLLAAFWDDLSVEPGASVRSATVGSAGARRFIVEWNAVNTIGLEAELRFQIKLFETSNVIEFHYCTMTDLDMSDRHSGAEATIGLQNFAGTAASQVSFDTAGTTPTGAWIRFTPR